ncbi:UDP-glucose 4-epimerase GalE [Rhabdothermincola salaria]|uniref:UDP-glucose 4-epimerase GalE n=1 Tax=Rhabdothermincola salaria TaxID=2903142 RepID=UPI001E5C52A6|nr:UDP-glucose 4-epimerase GalE [Rhabdothermincola salaria]MCD9622929.1 UDP-glucose 4-epimerase GalE [Rhabdothermincola salaria]
MSGAVLLTGGAGYIGSHTCLVLLEAGHDVVVVDDLSNASEESLRRVAELTGRPVAFHQVDLRDTEALDAVVAEHPIESVVHFAGLKAVGESVEQPLRYYDVNVGGTVSLLDVLQRRGIRRLVFSSSATVYGEPETVPIDEAAPVGATNPYGRTKLVIEQILADVAVADPAWHMVALRYFNPVGAHPSGRIGEDPRGIPNNLMPFVMQVAVGRRDELVVFGDDYPTPDGTCVRDYIHVMDLAEGHRAALDRLDDLPGYRPVNLGTGSGSTVLEVVAAASRAVGRRLPRRVGDRRAGDVVASFADPSRAQQVLGWQAGRGLDEMCADAWRWQSNNPQGYATP